LEEAVRTGERVDPHDADLGQLARENARAASVEFFGEARPVSAEDWTKAAAGLVTLVVLGLIIVSQVL